MKQILLIFLGGGCGSVLRYLAGTAIMSRYGGRFPLGTVLINISGSFAIGLIMTLLARAQAHPNWRLLLVVGVLGGYTTFSSFEYETYYAVRSGASAIGLLNVVGSVLFGYGAVWVGSMVAGRQ
jgi:CrcB protein